MSPVPAPAPQRWPRRRPRTRRARRTRAWRRRERGRGRRRSSRRRHRCDPAPSRGRLPEAPLLAEEDEHGLDATVDVLLLAEVALREDSADVLLDSSLAEHERFGDGGVVLALRHLGQGLAFPW